MLKPAAANKNKHYSVSVLLTNMLHGQTCGCMWLKLIRRLVSTVHMHPANHLDILSCLFWRLWLPSVSQLTDNPLQGSDHRAEWEQAENNKKNRSQRQKSEHSV